MSVSRDSGLQKLQLVCIYCDALYGRGERSNTRNPSVCMGIYSIQAIWHSDCYDPATRDSSRRILDLPCMPNGRGSLIFPKWANSAATSASQLKTTHTRIFR